MPKHNQTALPGSESRSELTGPHAKQAAVRRVQRSAINPAQYNPRTISDYARKQLKSSLSTFGLVETPVWNETTGNLVSGHQRLSILDREFGYPGADYTIDVSVVALSLREEKKLNVWLNNHAAQGQFDEAAFLEFMASEPGLKLEDLGLNAVDLDFDFGGSSAFAQLLESEKKASDAIKRDVDEIKKRKKIARQEDNAEPEQDADYFVMVAFESKNAKDAWLRQHNLPPTSRYVSFAEMAATFESQP